MAPVPWSVLGPTNEAATLKLWKLYD